MSKTINGKKPLSSKPKTQGPLGRPDFFKDKLSIPAYVAEDLAAKNLEARWINYKGYVDNGNEHDRGWYVYKAPKTENTDTFLTGTNPDGILRRGDLVLAARPMEQGDQHRAWLRSKADIQNNFKKSKASELKQLAREGGLDAEVHEGYEEND